jgi:hypothetical protein
MSNRIARLCGVALCVAAVLVASLPTASGAAGSKQLRRVKGNVGYQPASVAAITPIFGKIDLPDDATAVTEANSLAELALPDSSIVTLGAGTHVKIGAFNETADGPGSTIQVDGGTLRFDIKRPAGGRANYQFQTATSQIAVRGTIGLLSVINGVTTVGCVQCAADSVVVTTGGQTFALATGQILTVTAVGAAVPGALTPAASAGFGASGVSTGAGAGAGAGAGGAIAAGAAAAAAGAAIANGISRPTNSPQPTQQPTSGPTPTTAPVTPTPSPAPTKSGSTPTPTPTPAPSATPTATPVPTPTPTSAGNVNITSKRTLPAATGTAPSAAPPPASRPIASPPTPGGTIDLPGTPIRGRR